MTVRILAFTLLLLLAAACDNESDGDSGRSNVKITTTALPNTFNGTPYSEQLVATSGVQPYSWSIATGALPNGLTLDSATGIVSGSANDAEGNYYYFTVEVKDAAGDTAQADLSIFLDGIVVPFEGE